MPLVKSPSKKAFEKNVKTEMDVHPDKRKQDLAIAYSIQRRAKRKKKMAEGGKLTTEDREHIKSKNFALPEERKYPIEDESHARNALARVSQFGSPEEKAEVRRKVHNKYPEMKAEGGMLRPEDHLMDDDEEDLVNRIRHHMKKMAHGGQVDLEENSMEHPEMYDELNEEALDRDPDSQLPDLDIPEDDDEHGEDPEEEDMISKIRRKMKHSMR